MTLLIAAKMIGTALAAGALFGIYAYALYRWVRRGGGE